MRILVLSLFVGVVLTAPQGYNYRVHLGSNNNEGLTYAQLQLLQQYASQHEQSAAQHQIITITEPAAPAIPQNVGHVNDNGGFPIQQTQQLVSYEEQQQVQLPQQLQPAVQAAVSQTELPTQQAEEISLLVQQPTLPVEQPQPQQQPLQQLLSQPQLQHQQYPQPQPQIQFQFQPQPQPEPQPELQQQQLVQQSSSPLLSPPLQTTHDQLKTVSVNIEEPAQYTKEFYYLSAPEEIFELPHDFQNMLNKIKKNLRVLFIKAPEQNGIEKAALQLAKDMQNSQTAIYVLMKQHSAADLAHKLQQLRATSPQKPEVVFVKYRTPEEAVHAQRTIQSQYESLNGPNHFIHDGPVATLHFNASLAAIEPRESPMEESAATKAATPASLEYLPPAK